MKHLHLWVPYSHVWGREDHPANRYHEARQTRFCLTCGEIIFSRNAASSMRTFTIDAFFVVDSPYIL